MPFCQREELGFTPEPTSDCGSLLPAAEKLRKTGISVRSMRDATRGGVAAVLHEWARASGHSMWIKEQSLPVDDTVRGVSELLGLDPLHIANEGTMVIAVEAGVADATVAVLRGLPQHAGAARIGSVQPAALAAVIVERGTGRAVPLDEPQGPAAKNLLMPKGLAPYVSA